jgi:hypothetical protein
MHPKPGMTRSLVKKVDKTPVELFIDDGTFSNASGRKTLPGNSEDLKF